MATDPRDRRSRQRRAVLLGTAGLLMALGLGAALRLAGFVSVHWDRWVVALGLTIALQGLLVAILHRGADLALRWDPHFLYLPMTVAAVLFCVYAWSTPEARGILLMGWFVVLLFMAGLAGVRAVLLLSALMAVGYLAVLRLLAVRGEIEPTPIESAAVIVFLAVSVYAGVVLERLRRQRIETKHLRSELSELALTDSLTGLPNRRHFEAILHAELARIDRYGGSCAVSMIDLDRFKDYNDRFGHLAGDQVLRDIAGLLRDQLRKSDLAARLGGEEFGVIMTDTLKGAAVPVIERLRLAVEAHRFAYDGQPPGPPLTLSAGIAACPEDATDYHRLIRLADQALYHAKAQGRNLVFTAPPSG